MMSGKKFLNGNRDKDINYDQELEVLEQEVVFMLKEYDVEYPSESEMLMTIEAIRPYVPVKENKWKTIYENMASIMKHSLHEIFYVSPLFWVSNLLFLLIGLTYMFASELNPYVMILVLAPIPTITGIIEVQKRMNSGMAELEMSFQFSLQEIILSRMLIVGGFNLLINIVFTFVIAVSFDDILIWKLLLNWIMPFTLTMAVAFIALGRFRNTYAITAGLAIWIVIGTFINQTRLAEKIEHLPVPLSLLITFLALILTFIKITQIYKRGVLHEFNH
jgi:hypothetical protein